VAATAPWPPSAAARLLHRVSFGHLRLASPLCQKTFLLARMATNRELLEPHGDGHLPSHAMLKDKHNTISLVLILSFWLSVLGLHGKICVAGGATGVASVRSCKKLPLVK